MSYISLEIIESGERFKLNSGREEFSSQQHRIGAHISRYRGFEPYPEDSFHCCCLHHHCAHHHHHCAHHHHHCAHLHHHCAHLHHVYHVIELSYTTYFYFFFERLIIVRGCVPRWQCHPSAPALEGGIMTASFDEFILYIFTACSGLSGTIRWMTPSSAWFCTLPLHWGSND